MQDEAEEVMQDEVEGGKVSMLDEERAVKKRRCNTKHHSTFRYETTGEGSNIESEREREVQCF